MMHEFEFDASIETYASTKGLVFGMFFGTLLWMCIIALLAYLL